MINILKRIFGFLKRNQENIIILIAPILIFLILYFSTDIINIYNSNSLNQLILSIFGTLFGLLFTAYTISFGVIPSLSINTLETNAIKNINFKFFISLIINIFIIILGFIIFFVGDEYKSVFIYSQIFSVIVLIFLFSLLIFYLFLLFKVVRNKAIKEGEFKK